MLNNIRIQTTKKKVHRKPTTDIDLVYARQITYISIGSPDERHLESPIDDNGPLILFG